MRATAINSRHVLLAPLLALLLGSAGCGGDESEGAGGEGSYGGREGGGRGAPAAAVPVEVAAVVRRDISSFIETNGTLEAENEVDLVARMSGPIVALRAEEGDRVSKGQLLARIDDEEIRARREISRVALEEARLSFERAEQLRASQLVSPEEFEQARTRFETARAQFEGNEVLMSYTEVRAPFEGLIVARYVDFAQQVSPNLPLFRISDFDPLLCPIQVPERDLPQLRIGQRAELAFEAWPDERFQARVLRVSPVVDSATGTVKVTLEVETGGRLRPGMFARVYVETETRTGSLVIPKAALSLESLGDTVYVAEDGAASRREVVLGFREGEFVEAVRGLEEGEKVVVVGNEGLSEGTPIGVMGEGDGTGGAALETRPAGTGGPSSGDAAVGEGPPDLSNASPEQIEEMRQRMRARGLSEREIEERLRRLRERS